MKIALTTYDTAHLKTAQVFFGLHNRGAHEISFLDVPYSPRPAREVVFAHRPHQFRGVSARDIADGLKLPYRSYDERNAVLDEVDYIIVCGANILEPDFAKSGKIINGHAGLVPHVRGLDSFKWAILDGVPVGNTLHIIDEEADMGEVLHQLVTPLFRSDTLETFADRHYNNEIFLLTHFDHYIENGETLGLSERKARMRMPMAKEHEFVAAFESYKQKFAL